MSWRAVNVAGPTRFQGRYFFSDFGAGFVASVPLTTSALTYTGQPGNTFATGLQGPLDIAVTTDGDLLVLCHNSGSIERFRFQV